MNKNYKFIFKIKSVNAEFKSKASPPPKKQDYVIFLFII